MDNKILMCFLSVLIVVSSCKRDKEDSLIFASDELTISANLGQMSANKSLKLGTTFDVGDEISVYGWTGTAQSIAAEFQINNSINTLGDDGSWTAEPKMLWKDGSSKHYFLGIYPQKAVSDFVSDEYTLNTADQEASDVLIATNLEGISCRPAAVPLTFTHLMSRLDVNIKVVNFSSEPTEAIVKVKGQTNATINYLTKKVTATGDVSEIVLPEVSKADGYILSYNSIMVPQAGISEVVVIIDGQTFTYTHSKDFSLKNGYYTTVNLTLRRSELILDNVNIVDWNKEEEINTEVSDAVSGNRGFANGHEWVDLGLSVKWATVNVGASKPQDAGNYYAWGEVETREVYTTLNYNVEAFVGDYIMTLEKEDDAAAVNWHGDWRMPTRLDWEELKNATTQTWTDDYNGTGISGCILTSNVEGYTDVTLFFPSEVDYWTSSLWNDFINNGACWSAKAHKVSSQLGDIFKIDSEERCYGLSIRPICPSYGNANSHDFVNLGLSSGNLWATCNIGANVPEELGDRFSWGETSTKSDYSWDTYKHISSDGSGWEYINKYQNKDGHFEAAWYDTKYTKDKDGGITTLEVADDVASQLWGDNWRMPTTAEWQELCNNTTQTWTDDYSGTGVKGCIFTSTKEGYMGVSFFLPSGGYYQGEHFNSSVDCSYWSSSLSDFTVNYAYEFFCSPSQIRHYSSFRWYGHSIRPVCHAM